ncbi:protein NETWORKED 2B-like [Impatiens glandulifera]|uniref:protein NETWORKED 2B-like n=1 Tax=Impatiens glandulifera TaxID=253017 RepID=UPI001FB0A2DC|nr:protein NETWORKED 2B-like [Impatiens glandulifera]
MEEKVDYMLKMIDQDGDSFAQRAEMYYRKRPEILSFVEDFFRGYRALAERYDHLSRELQSANRTIASVCPEQINLRIDEEDDNQQHDDNNNNKPYSTYPPTSPNAKPIPNAPKTPRKFQKMPSRLMSKKGLLTKPNQIDETPPVSSGLTKEEALIEIDSLQKTILGLQTEKEFIRSTYERAVSVCEEIEERFTEMQRKVNSLQDEFGIGTFIEDDEARKLMVASAMKSCQDALLRVRQKQEKLSEEAIMEHQRIIQAREKIGILKGNESDPETENRDFELLRDNIKTQLLDGSCTSVTMSELAEKLDELVDKVIVLESAVSSQNASVNRLRTEADELEEAIIKGSQNLEVEFERIENLDKNVKTQNVNLQIHLIEASCSYDHLSDKLQTVKPDDDNVMFMEARAAPPSVKPVQLPQLSIEEKIVNLMRPTSHHQRNQAIIDQKSDSNGGSKDDDMIYSLNPFISSDESVGQFKEDVVHSEAFSQKGDQWVDFSGNFDSHSHHQAIIEDPVETKSNLTHHEKEQDKKQKEDDNQQFPYSSTANHRDENAIQVDELSNEPDKKQEEDEKQLFPYNPTANHNENTVQVEEWFKEQDKKQQEENKQEFPFNPVTNHHENTIHVEDWFKEQDDKQQVHHSPATNHNDLSEEKDQVSGIKKSNNKEMEGGDKTEDGDDDPNWRELFLSGLDDREKNLLKEYTSVLRNFKEAKKKLSELEKKNNDSLFKTSMQIKDLKNDNALKDAEIKSLHQKLGLLQSCLDETPTDREQVPELLLVEEEEQQQQQQHQCIQSPPIDLEKEEDGKMVLVDEPLSSYEPRSSNSIIEEKFRTDIDGLLEENIEFWLRFSTSFHQITKFQTSVQDLQAEFLRIKKHIKQEGGHNKNHTVNSDLRPVYKHLREIQTELALWVEHNSLLEDDLQNRVTSLGEIQQEIVRVSNSNEESKEEGVVVELNGYQAAKFQGEVINMKQENNKVVQELQAGLDHVKELQVDITRTISELEEAIGITGSKGKSSRSKIPLRSLLFGARLRKQRPSLFQCLTPTLQKQYSDLGSPPSPPPPPPPSSSS